MDLPQFLSALLAIIVIDIVLAGDNAIVIAMAARNLPAHLQKRAIVWGTVGAIVVRGLMTVAVVWLLAVPGLRLAGGLMLLWIAYRLLAPAASGHETGQPAATSLWSAMRTIVVADAVMGLDNVLAVAGAAHGHYGLVFIGLAISVPIVVWGSTIVVRIIERHPAIVYLGAAVLLWTAASMIVHEPLLARLPAGTTQLSVLTYLAIPLVLWLGFVRNHQRVAARIDQRLAQWRPLRPRGASMQSA